MGELLDSSEPIKPLRRGDVVEGIVMRADADGIFVNIGHKAEGVVPPGEMRTLAPGELSELKVGDSLVTFVVKNETAEQAAILSIDRAVGEHGWRTLEKMMESRESVDGKILGFNRGGAIVEVEGIQGFVPMSQLVSVSRAHIREIQEASDKAERGEAEEAAVGEQQQVEVAAEEQQAEAATGEQQVEAAAEEQQAEAATGEQQVEAAAEEQQVEAPTGEQQSENEGTGDSQQTEAVPQDPRVDDVGKVLTLKVLEVNRGRNRAIFSERQAIQEQREERKSKLIEELTEGEVRHGRVTGISSFGAFVDLGGADGLIHISELSWNPVNSPEEVVQVGEEIDVSVLRIDAENKKIALSLRRLQPEPWDSINERYNVGDIIDATVTKLTNFGAFARVEGIDGSVEGLVHISELTDHMINHPREVVREGEVVKLKILRIEPDRRRLGLSLKQAAQEF